MIGRILFIQSGHRAQVCLPHCCRTMLPDGVILHHVILRACVWEKCCATP